MTEPDFERMVQEVGRFGQRLARLERAMLLFWDQTEDRGRESELEDLLAQIEAEQPT